MAEKKEDEIMAEYLLKGGKMLEKGCRTCGCPMFEYKGRTFCVVCAEHGQQTQEKDSPPGVSPGAGAPPSPVTAGAGQGSPAVPATIDTRALEDDLVTTVHNLCARIRADDDTDRCLTLMDSVKIGIEALSCLRQR
jgi:UPF0148 protein